MVNFREDSKKEETTQLKSLSSMINEVQNKHGEIKVITGGIDENIANIDNKIDELVFAVGDNFVYYSGNSDHDYYLRHILSIPSDKEGYITILNMTRGMEEKNGVFCLRERDVKDNIKRRIKRSANEKNGTIKFYNSTDLPEIYGEAINYQESIT